jgi:hypothetical protein
MGARRRDYDGVDLLSAVFVLMTITMTALKMSGVVDFSWWFITSPVWIPTVLVSCVVGYFALLTRLEEFAKRDLKNK